MRLSPSVKTFKKAVAYNIVGVDIYNLIYTYTYRYKK